MSLKHEHLLLENQLYKHAETVQWCIFRGPTPAHPHPKSLFRTPSDWDLQNACTGLRVEERCPPHGRKPNVERLKNRKIGFKKGWAKISLASPCDFLGGDGEVKRPFQMAVCDLQGSPGCFQPFNLQPAAKRGWEKNAHHLFQHRYMKDYTPWN